MNKVLDSMDSDLQSSPSENGGTKAAFRKPSNDAAHRKYRRRSPNARSPSPDDGPNRERSSSPIRQDTAKVSDDRRRKDDERDLDRHHHGRSQYGRSSDSYRQSSRSSSHNYYPRQQDYDVVKHADEDERSKSSSRSSRHTTRRESEHERSKENLRNVSSKYSRDKSEGSGYRSKDKERESSVEYKKNKDVENLGSFKGERPPVYDEGKRRTIISLTQRDSEEDISPPKKPKLFSDRDIEHVKDVSKFTNKVEEKQQSSSSSKQVQDSAGKVTSEQDFVKDSDIDAAKVAAIKAAELVNRNLIGTGYMSTDQKKKLLWGNKKAATTTTEEPAHRWDASLSLFPDQERQEKFKKLMGVKGELKVESSGLLQAEEEKQKELQLDLEKQYTAGLRRRDGRTVGLGL